MLVGSSSFHVSALPTKIPVQTVQNSEEQLNNNIFNIFISFVSGVFNHINSQSIKPIVTSENVSTFSDTIKNYESVQQNYDNDYETSKEKDKLEFGTGILDLISGILKFFGM